METPGYLAEAQRLDLEVVASNSSRVSAGDVLLQLVANPNVASKHWVYRQYDHMVRTNTVNLPGVGAAVVRIKGTDRALAMSLDGNGRYCLLDPKLGAMLAVAEAARNVACAGARPLATTNCLNFGNPERPAIMWQFAKAVEGLGVAFRALDVPITGGNVSLYNETDGRAIQPTPIVGVVGLLDHVDHVLTGRFQRAGDLIILLGEGRGELGGSLYLEQVHGLVRGLPPALDLAAEKALQSLLVGLAAQRLLHSAQDCSDGGLAVAVAESCFGSGAGAEIAIEGVAVSSDTHLNAAAALFGETASRVVVSAASDRVTDILQMAAAAHVPARVIGETGGNRLRMSVAGRVLVDVAVEEAERAWSSTIDRLFSKKVA
jgi:phosphoribosylformylglycinamidine synthase